MRLYHGTGVEWAFELLNGDALDVTTALTHHWNGAPGFYLATEQTDAEFFALRRAPGYIVAFDIDDDVIEELVVLGAVRKPIPESPGSAHFKGDEIYLPVQCFATFNSARTDGRIHATRT
jgi:hypothetical protein